MPLLASNLSSIFTVSTTVLVSHHVQYRFVYKCCYNTEFFNNFVYSDKIVKKCLMTKEINNSR